MEKEQTRVLKGRTGGDLLVLCNLSKSYRSLSKRRAAVHDVSLGLRRGEVRECPCAALSGRRHLLLGRRPSQLPAAFEFQRLLHSPQRPNPGGE